METVIELAKNNSRIDSVKTFLSDSPEYKEVRIILKTNRNLYEWAKSVYVYPSESEGRFEVHIECSTNPKQTLINRLYEENKIENWVAPKYGHDTPYLKLLLTESDLRKIIIWKHSTIN